MRLYISLILTLILSLSGLAQDKKKENGFPYQLKGGAIGYSGYRKGQNPKKEIFPTKAQVLEDLQLLNKYWACIRTYGADQHAEDVLAVIRENELDLKVLLGIWLDGEPKYKEDNVRQIEKGIQLANRYSDIVVAITVGNESQIHWSDHKVPPEQLIAYIQHVKDKTQVPVTTADTWDYWTNTKKSQPVIDAVDFIAAHIYPIWGGVDIDKALEVTIEDYEALKKAIPDQPIVITEAGWASYTRGKQHARGAGNETKQLLYFGQLMTWSKESHVIVFWFEAFDESWKGSGTEGHWGLFNEDRTPKKAIQHLFPNK